MWMSPNGPVLVTTLADARTVLTDIDDFVTPFDVSRRPVRRGRRQPREKPTAMLDAAAVGLGTTAFQTELDRAAARAGLECVGGAEVDMLRFLRGPVARSTTAALIPGLSESARDRVGSLVVEWIDALAPVISARRPPVLWSRVRVTERRAHRAVVRELARVGSDDGWALATALAAGIQVPIAAGAWCVTILASRPDLHQALGEEPALVPGFVWEVLRLYPPTWLLPRVTTRDVSLGIDLPAYTPVLASPVLLGRLSGVVPGPEEGFADLDEIDPSRWSQNSRRPGGWLPFGAGPHACPGRNLGLAQLGHLVRWSLAWHLSGPAPRVDSQRGLAPTPADVIVRQRAH